MTSAAKWFRQQCDAEDEESDAFCELVVCGMDWHIGKLHRAARYDARMATGFLDVANLKAPSARRLQPAIVMRVIRGSLWPPQRRHAGHPAGAQA